MALAFAGLHGDLHRWVGLGSRRWHQLRDRPHHTGHLVDLAIDDAGGTGDPCDFGLRATRAGRCTAPPAGDHNSCARCLVDSFLRGDDHLVDAGSSTQHSREFLDGLFLR